MHPAVVKSTVHVWGRRWCIVFEIPKTIGPAYLTDREKRGPAQIEVVGHMLLESEGMENSNRIYFQLLQEVDPKSERFQKYEYIGVCRCVSVIPRTYKYFLKLVSQAIGTLLSHCQIVVVSVLSVLCKRDNVAC